MIITCPACATRYVVPDSAVGAEGRTVRCAKCRHSWFQEGPELAGAPPPPAAEEPEAHPAEPQSAPPPPPPEPRQQPEPEADVPGPTGGGDLPPLEETPPPPVAPPAYIEDGDTSHFDHQPPFRRRRNTLKLWTYAGIVFALVVGALIVAVSYWGLPEWVPVSRPTFAAAQEDLQLDFPPDQQERRQLPDGTEYFGASGSITNTGSMARDVPPILIVLRDERDRIVYSWEVYPPQRSLAPGESITINQAVTDVPRAARVAEIGWKPS
jgi:predicted Zn finger-like uncharacterized protein